MIVMSRAWDNKKNYALITEFLEAGGERGHLLRLYVTRVLKRASCIVYNVLKGWSRGQKNEQENNVPSPEKQCSCRLSGSSENRTFKRCRSTA